MMTTSASIARMVLVACIVAAGCGHGMNRDQAAYRDATREVIAARSGQIKSCYDAVLAQQPALAGRVVVSFKVAAETGQVFDPAIDKAGTTAPPDLSQCVLRAMDGVALNPPDKKEAQATFSWNFAPGA
jgi:hypothetical protein